MSFSPVKKGQRENLGNYRLIILTLVPWEGDRATNPGSNVHHEQGKTLMKDLGRECHPSSTS